MPRSRRFVLAAFAALAAVAIAAAAPAAARAAPPSLSSSAIGEQPNGGGVFRFVQAVAYYARRRDDLRRRPVQRCASRPSAATAPTASASARARRGASPAASGSSAASRWTAPATLYVLDSENDRVQVFSAADGTPLASFGDATIFDLAANDPAIGAGISASGLAVRPAHRVLAADGLRRRPGPQPRRPLHAGRRARSCRRAARRSATRASGSAAPQGIAVDQGGTRVYVADNQNDRVLVLDPQSLLLVRAQSAPAGGGPAQFQAPYDVARRLPPAAAPVRRRQPQQPRRRSSTRRALGFLGVSATSAARRASSRSCAAVGGLTDDPQRRRRGRRHREQPDPDRSPPTARCMARVGHRRPQRGLLHTPARRRIRRRRRHRRRRQLQLPRRPLRSRRDVLGASSGSSARSPAIRARAPTPGQFSLPAGGDVRRRRQHRRRGQGQRSRGRARPGRDRAARRRRPGSSPIRRADAPGPRGSMLVADNGQQPRS